MDKGNVITPMSKITTWVAHTHLASKPTFRHAYKLSALWNKLLINYLSNN